MSTSISDALMLALIGFGGGVILGLAARLGRFCTLGAIEDYLYQGDSDRLRMWALAIGVAGIGTFGLVAAGALDPAQTIYHLAPWSPAFGILGGLLFGYGMALAGNCGFGALARFGGGDLRSFMIVLVMAVATFVMLSGPLAHLRLAGLTMTEMPTQIRSYPEGLTALAGGSAAFWGLLVSAALTLWALTIPLQMTGKPAVQGNSISAIPAAMTAVAAPSASGDLPLIIRPRNF
jgi:hypothetical protein